MFLYNIYYWFIYRKMLSGGIFCTIFSTDSHMENVVQLFSFVTSIYSLKISSEVVVEIYSLTFNKKW